MWKQFEEDPEVEVVFLMNTANAFNRLNREQALAEVRKSWPRAARFIFNAYYTTAVVSGPGKASALEQGSQAERKVF